MAFKNKRDARIRRARRTRIKIRQLQVPRLTVYRSPRHIYVQLIDDSSSKVLAAASTLDKNLRDQVKYTGNAEAAGLVGKLIAERAKIAGIERVAFDRSGFQYHGRIKALADAARENGLQF